MYIQLCQFITPDNSWNSVETEVVGAYTNSGYKLFNSLKREENA